MNNPDDNNPAYAGQGYANGQMPPQPENSQTGNPQTDNPGYYGQGYGPMPPAGGYQYQGQPGYGPPPAGMHPGYMAPGYYSMPPYGGYMGGPPPGMEQPGPETAPNPEQTAARAGLTAALGDLADKSGLGMFKDLFDWEDTEFWKGAMVGAAAVMLLTNESLRNSLIGGVAKTAESMKSGLAGFNTDDDEQEDDEPKTEEEIKQTDADPQTAESE